MSTDGCHARELRRDIRSGKLTGGSAGLGRNFVQVNLAVLPPVQAYGFLLFCQRNAQPGPLIEVCEPGSPEPVGVAPGADLRPGIARYRVYEQAEAAAEVDDIRPDWRDDLVALLAAL